MPNRVVVTLHLPMEMGAAGRILKAIAKEFPDAIIDQTSGDGSWRIAADPELSPEEKRRIGRERRHPTRTTQLLAARRGSDEIETIDLVST